MSTMERVAENMWTGARVAEGDRTWVKENTGVWYDDHEKVINNREVDWLLSTGRGTIVYDAIELETEPVGGYDLEPGDYIVVSRHFVHAAGEDTLEENVDQQLWRVVGYTWHGSVNSTVLLDAPEDLLRQTQYDLAPEGGYELEPVELYVDENKVFHLVTPGQEHERWDDDWDWTEHDPGYTIVEARGR